MCGCVVWCLLDFEGSPETIRNEPAELLGKEGNLNLDFSALGALVVIGVVLACKLRQILVGRDETPSSNMGIFWWAVVFRSVGFDLDGRAAAHSQKRVLEV